MEDDKPFLMPNGKKMLYGRVIAATPAERAATFREKQIAAGLVQVNAWVPLRAAPDFAVAAALLREDRDLSLGQLRNVKTGHFRSI